jgi:hypothetical protein
MSLEHAPQRQRRRPLRGRFPPLLVPILDAFEILAVGTTKGYEMVNAGIIETVRIGRSRYATQTALERIATSGAHTAPVRPGGRRGPKPLGDEPGATE